MNEFDKDRKGTGTLEWADWTENIQHGCANECLYCYAAFNAVVKFKNIAPGEWNKERFTGRVRLKSYPKREGVGMFPTTHDITPFNVDECVRILTLMLEAGNNVLIVTKPQYDCTVKVFDALQKFKDQILFRFTIGTGDNSVMNFWEPGASTPGDRIACLIKAHIMGFKTSVSMEPFLSSVDETITLVDIISPYVSNSIWIGKMNKIDDRVLTARPDMLDEIEKIKNYQADSEILRLVKVFESNPIIFWKDSIKEVINK
jgi:DNA repair photolyase